MLISINKYFFAAQLGNFILETRQSSIVRPNLTMDVLSGNFECPKTQAKWATFTQAIGMRVEMVLQNRIANEWGCGFDEPSDHLHFTYRNYKGEVSERRVVPYRVYYGATGHHTEPQWLLRGFDIEKLAIRTYALSDVLALHNLVPQS